MTRPISIACAVLAGASALTGCAGGSSQALSMEEYVQRADAICRQEHEELKGLEDEMEHGHELGRRLGFRVCGTAG
jgi:hypothetical protein